MKQLIHKHVEYAPKVLKIAAAVGTLFLIASGHGPGRWFYEGTNEIADFSEPILREIAEKIDI